MSLLTLDFESYYDATYSLRKLTVPQYVHDPRFHVHGLAIRHPDGRMEFRADVEKCLLELQGLYGAGFEKAVVICHNAAFDLYILNHRFGIRVAKFIDTMLLSYAVHGRKGATGGADASLKGLADRYGLQAKGDLEFMLSVRNPTGLQVAQLTDYAVNDVELTYQLALKLLPAISLPKVELPILQHTVRLFTERGVVVDLVELQTLRAKIVADTAALLNTAGLGEEDASSNARFATALGEALGRTGRLVPMKQGKKGPIPAIAKKDPELATLLDDDDPLVAALVAARVGHRSAQSLVARLDTLEAIAKATGGILPVHITYAGAHTGRFSGGGKFNIQNLGRGGSGGDVRALLRPAPGQMFVIGDFAQIEARITAWLAGQEDLLAAFADGQDVYSAFISRALGWTVRKPTKDDSAADAAALKAKRQVGKQAVLGLGFGMGALKFLNTLGQDPDAARLFGDGTLSPLICEQITQAFRTQYDAIPRLWNDLEEAFRNAMSGATVSVGPVSFGRNGESVEITLPSGRRLRYADPRYDLTPRTIPYLKDGEVAEFTPDTASIVYGNDTTIYGGKLTENIAQAVARDLLVEAVLKLEADGYSVVFHVHDEIVLQVPTGQADEAKADMEQVMSSTPAWAQGLPIAAEVHVAERYGK